MTPQQAAAIFDRMELLGIAHIEAQYSGSEDSGQFDGFECRNAKGEHIGEIALDKPLGETEQLRKVTAKLMDVVDQSFKEELEQAAWDAVDKAGYTGFWNNGGGDGRLVFDSAARTITLEHRNRIESFEESTHDVFGGEVSEADAFAVEDSLASGSAP